MPESVDVRRGAAGSVVASTANPTAIDLVCDASGVSEQLLQQLSGLIEVIETNLSSIVRRVVIVLRQHQRTPLGVAVDRALARRSLASVEEVAVTAETGVDALDERPERVQLWINRSRLSDPTAVLPVLAPVLSGHSPVAATARQYRARRWQVARRRRRQTERDLRDIDGTVVALAGRRETRDARLTRPSPASLLAAATAGNRIHLWPSTGSADPGFTRASFREAARATQSRRLQPAAHGSQTSAIARLTLLAILIGFTAVELAGIGGLGWQNIYYAAGIWSGVTSWSAFFFNGLDPASGMTVDKPPLAFWVMSGAARLFGFTPTTIALTSIAIGWASVLLLYATVRRLAGVTAGLVAAIGLAVTPVAVWMFHADYPDPLMILTMTAAVYCAVRAVTGGAPTWMLAAGVSVGLGFATKSLEAVVVVPAILISWSAMAPTGWRSRTRGLVCFLVAAGCVGGWWFLLVDAWPASSRPIVAGTPTNSTIELAFGYNGVDRIGLSSQGLVASGRLLSGQMAALISFTLVPSLVALAVVGWDSRNSLRSRLVLLLLGTWLVVGVWILTFSHGIINPYYALMIAPPAAGLIGTAVAVVGKQSSGTFTAAFFRSAMMACAGVWGALWFGHTNPILAWTIGGCALAAILAMLVDSLGHRWPRGALACLLAGAILLPSAAAAAAEAGRNHETGASSAIADPHIAAILRTDNPNTRFAAAVNGGRAAAYLELVTHRPVLDVGGFSGHGPLPTVTDLASLVAAGQLRYYICTSTIASWFDLIRSSPTPLRWACSHFATRYSGNDIRIVDLTRPILAPLAQLAPSPPPSANPATDSAAGSTPRQR